MSVKVFKIDNEEVIARLKSWAKIQSRDENIVGIILFGSLVKKEATPASDADIVLLLKSSKERFDVRIPRYLPKKIGLGVDLFPYTIEEFSLSLKENWGVAKEALAHGILLYGINIDQNQPSLQEWFQSLLEIY